MKTTAIGTVLLAGLAASLPGAASAQDDELQDAIERCKSGSAWYCVEATSAYSKLEDPETPVKTLEYAKLACDKGSSLGCRYQVLTARIAGNAIHQRILKTRISGDPKGEWQYRSDINAAIDRARAYYEQARDLDPNIDEDWDKLFADLENLRLD